MYLNAKSVGRSSLLGAVVLATALIAQGAYATAIPVEATAALQAATITKRAEAIALQAVGGGTVVLAVLEREDGLVHWSVDITGSAEEYEVWVSTHGKLLALTLSMQPRHLQPLSSACIHLSRTGILVDSRWPQRCSIDCSPNSGIGDMLHPSLFRRRMH